MFPFVENQTQARPVNFHQAPLGIHHPDRFEPHVAEDLGDISPAVFSVSRDPKTWYSIHEADSISKQLGSQLARHVLDPNKLMNSVAYRMETFDHAGWQGAGKEEMAQSGFYFDESTGSVWCFVCRVKFRDMNRPGILPWQVHAELAPNCCQLKRFQSSGHQPSARSKRRRHNSTSSVADMTRDRADTINP